MQLTRRIQPDRIMPACVSVEFSECSETFFQMRKASGCTKATFHEVPAVISHMQRDRAVSTDNAPARTVIHDGKKRQGDGMGRSWHGDRHLSHPEMGTIVRLARDRRV